MARRQRKASGPRIADLIVELRTLHAVQIAMRAELDEHARTLKIQFQRIAQLQAALDVNGGSRKPVATLTPPRRGPRTPSA